MAACCLVDLQRHVGFHYPIDRNPNKTLNQPPNIIQVSESFILMKKNPCGTLQSAVTGLPGKVPLPPDDTADNELDAGYPWLPGLLKILYDVFEVPFMHVLQGP